MESPRTFLPRLIGALVVVLALGSLGRTAEAFAGPEYEMALAAGLLCPSVAALVTALEQSRARRGPFDAFCRAIENGLMYAVLAFLVACVHGLRDGFCDLPGSIELFALGPGMGTVMGGLWGALAGEVAGRRKRRRLTAVLGGLAGPVGSVLVQLGLFYATPMVFAYDPFVGYFSGALYDTVLAGDGLLHYRMASAGTVLAAYVAALHLERAPEGGLRYRSLERPGMLAVGVVALAGSLGSVALGNELDHWQTRDTIARELGGELTVGRCAVIYDARLGSENMQRFAEDCDAHVERIAAWLALPGPVAPVTAYMFRDQGQKRRLMGAGRVSVAKPWRREIYLHDADYPHTVVAHELVHALASDIGSGPFGVTGWLPNPGLVEGLAEAAAPREDNLDNHEWAAAMRAINVLPRPEELFSLAFFGRASSAGYTAAGSFVEHVREAHGIDAIKRWYGGEELDAITGTSWKALEASWHERLDEVTLTDAARITAEVRFDRPSVFARRCPHVVDELLDDADGRVGSDNTRALELFGEVLDRDPANTSALVGIARCYDSQADAGAAQAAYDRVYRHEGVARGEQLGARERQGDLLLRAGDAAGAAAIYREVMATVTDEGRLRTLELKLHYAPYPLARRTFVALLIGTDHHGPNSTEAVDLMGEWRAADPEDGTPAYLLGRQHLNGKSYSLAIERLEEALDKKLTVARSESETLRLIMIAACALRDGARATSALERYVAHPLVTPTRAGIARALVERCTR